MLLTPDRYDRHALAFSGLLKEKLRFPSPRRHDPVRAFLRLSHRRQVVCRKLGKFDPDAPSRMTRQFGVGVHWRNGRWR